MTTNHHGKNSFDEQAAHQSTVYVDRCKLYEEWLPPRIVRRDSQATDLTRALAPVYEGETPNSVFLIGPPGTGKTVLAKRKLEELQAADGLETDLTTIWVNCSDIKSEDQIGIAIANQLRDPDDQLNHGHRLKDVWKKMFTELEKCGGTVLIVLDDLPAIEISSLVQQVHRARGVGGPLEDTRVGLLATSTAGDVSTRLSESVSVNLDPIVIRFPAYDANELIDILTARIDHAIRDEIDTTEGAALTAALIGRQDGNARRALDLFRRAADRMKRDGRTEIDDTDVEAADAAESRDRVIDSIQAMHDTGKSVMYAVLWLAADGESKPRTTEIYRRYCRIQERSGHESVTQKQVTHHLNSAAEDGLLVCTEHTGAGGRYNQYELTPDPASVRAGLDDYIDYIDLRFRTVEELRDDNGSDGELEEE